MDQKEIFKVNEGEKILETKNPLHTEDGHVVLVVVTTHRVVTIKIGGKQE